jgi:hypothetical protein
MQSVKYYNVFTMLPFDIVEKLVINYINVFDLYEISKLSTETSIVIHSIYNPSITDGNTVSKIDMLYKEAVELLKIPPNYISNHIEGISMILKEIQFMDEFEILLKSVNITREVFIKYMMYIILYTNPYSDIIKSGIEILDVVKFTYNIHELISHDFSKILSLLFSEFMGLCFNDNNLDTIYDICMFAYNHHFLLNLIDISAENSGMLYSIDDQQMNKFCTEINKPECKFIFYVIGKYSHPSMTYLMDKYITDPLNPEELFCAYNSGTLWTIEPVYVKTFLSTVLYRHLKPALKKEVIDDIDRYVKLSNVEVYADLLSKFNLCL